MHRRLLALALPIALLAACSQGPGGGGPPDERVAAAFERLGEYDGITMTLSLQSDPGSLSALAGSSGDQLDEATAEKILQSQIRMTQTQAEDPLDSQVELAADVAGIENAFEMKFVDRSLYLRADVRGLVDTFSPESAGEIDAFVSQAKTQGMSFAEPAVNGEWLSIKGLDQLMQQMGAPSPAKVDNAEAFRALGDAIRNDATVKEVGEDDAGTHYEMTISVRELYQRVLPQFKELASTSGAPVDAFPDASQVPDKDFTLDLWLDGDDLSQVEIDFMKLQELAEEELPEGVNRMALRLGLEEFTGSVEAPSDAVAIDPQQIFQSMFGAMSGGSGATETTEAEEAFPCDMLAEEPEEVQAMYYEQCPELQGA